jgi:hypothetical protein
LPSPDFFETITRLYLSGKFSFVVTARLDTHIEWFLTDEMHVTVTNVSRSAERT